MERNEELKFKQFYQDRLNLFEHYRIQYERACDLGLPLSRRENAEILADHFLKDAQVVAELFEYLTHKEIDSV